MLKQHSIIYIGTRLEIESDLVSWRIVWNKSFSPRINGNSNSPKNKVSNTQNSQKGQNNLNKNTSKEETKGEKLDENRDHKPKYNKMTFTNQNYLSKLNKIFDVFDAYSVNLLI